MGPAGWVLVWEQRYDETIELQREALAVLRRTGDRRLILRGLVFLAHALADKQDIAGTEAVLEEADVLAAGDPMWELTAIHADCAQLRGDGAAALELYAESLSWTRTTGESHQMLMDLRCVASELSELGAAAAAIEAFELVQLEEDRTGRTLKAKLQWFDDARAAAVASASREEAERAAARAREIPVGDRATHAIELARRVAAG